MSSRKQTVHTYFAGFREGDHAKILELLTDDVLWDIYGHRHPQGKAAFDGRSRTRVRGRAETVLRPSDRGERDPRGPHQGEVNRSDGGVLRFAAVDVFTFDGDLISRVESYVVPVTA